MQFDDFTCIVKKNERRLVISRILSKLHCKLREMLRSPHQGFEEDKKRIMGFQEFTIIDLCNDIPLKIYYSGELTLALLLKLLEGAQANYIQFLTTIYVVRLNDHDKS